MERRGGREAWMEGRGARMEWRQDGEGAGSREGADGPEQGGAGRYPHHASQTGLVSGILTRVCRFGHS